MLCFPINKIRAEAISSFESSILEHKKAKMMEMLDGMTNGNQISSEDDFDNSEDENQEEEEEEADVGFAKFMIQTQSTENLSKEFHFSKVLHINRPLFCFIMYQQSRAWTEWKMLRTGRNTLEELVPNF